MIVCPSLECYIAVLVILLLVSLYFNLQFSRTLKERDKGDGMLIKQAYFNPVTELPNRTNIEVVIGDQIDRSHRHEKPFLVAVLIVKEYKGEFIRSISDTLVTTFRDEDILAHIEDDTFVVVFNEYLQETNFEILLQRINAVFDKKITNEENESMKVELAIGHSKYPDDAVSISGLIEEATRKALK